MKKVCDEILCTGCRACAEICPKNAVNIVDLLRFQCASIDEDLCINCHLCEKVCQVIHPMGLRKPSEWYQGWIKSEEKRRLSSSGGFARAISEQIINEGGCVVSCCFKNGEFSYCAADRLEQLDEFRGSKYVKSNPSGAYKLVKNLLHDNKKVLFIGLPCHVGALKLYLGNEEDDNLITADLICHGSPSAELFKQFLCQYNLNPEKYSAIQFRNKGTFRVSCSGDKQGSNNANMITMPGVRDRYTIGFLKGLFYTENCYRCHYACSERVSDITLGDSWGSDLDEDERKRGISLALCQTEKGLALLKRSAVNLLAVDPEKAISANRQLKKPSEVIEEREIFFSELEKGSSFNRAVGKSFPKLCFKQDVKNTLKKMHIMK